MIAEVQRRLTLGFLLTTELPSAGVGRRGKRKLCNQIAREVRQHCARFVVVVRRSAFQDLGQTGAISRDHL
ncbi:MAG: hypothetical protein ABW275_05135 [Hansschlegelia sp.]